MDCGAAARHPPARPVNVRPFTPPVIDPDWCSPPRLGDAIWDPAVANDVARPHSVPNKRQAEQQRRGQMTGEERDTMFGKPRFAVR